MSLVAGSYERFIWGYKLKSRKHPHSLTLTPLFSFPSHLSTIKTVAVAGSAAVSAGNDDTIKIYDLSSSSEIGSFHHSSSITSLSFFSPPSLSSFPRNLLAADAEGSLSIYDADPFVHLKTLKVHKKAVNSLTVHPSGKLALTVGHDDCLAMVNLVRGRRSFYCKLSKEASIVQFDETGEKFFMVVDEKVSVHESEDAKLIVELDNRKRVLCAAPGASGILFTGGEDRNITAWDTGSGKVAYSIEDAHAARVKGIVVLSKNSGGSEEEDPYIVASASSDGVIRVWDVRMANKGKPTPLAEANTKSRLTCLAGSSIKSLKRPRLEMLNADENRGAAAVES
ncbi:p21-activated protein kinase-interacting protein 1-like [Sesamum alatum]|uniref:P21-activated protein kinase-interacting protein 1-like n=1 Tax=Sesamum alatum TaxID=300844 RepID=A0AAE1Z2H7_9LAMI|nr:p21-activated protein kinase-interacting protein 1-like [Sesamum alatum]